MTCCSRQNMVLARVHDLVVLLGDGVSKAFAALFLAITLLNRAVLAFGDCVDSALPLAKTSVLFAVNVVLRTIKVSGTLLGYLFPSLLSPVQKRSNDRRHKRRTAN